MLKIPTKVSNLLSIIMTVAFMVILVLIAILMPRMVEIFLGFPENSAGRQELLPIDYTAVTLLGYLAVAIMAAAAVMLLVLLLRVRNNLVFTAKSVGLIRGVSWCAVLLGGLFIGLGWYFLIAFFAAFAFIFLGICIRVVKNVIEQATEIKAENDFTI